MDKKSFRFKLDRDKIKLQLKDLGEGLRKKGALRNILSLVLLLVLLIGGFFFYRNVQEGKGEEFSPENPLIHFNYEKEEGAGDNNQARPGNFSLNYPALNDILDSNEFINISEEDLAEPAREIGEEEITGVVTEALRPVSTYDNREQGLELIRPVSGELVQTAGWYYNPVLEDWRYQEGVGFAGNTGDIVMAAAAGKVVLVEEDAYRGIMVVIEHENGWLTEYGHLERATVSPGSQVAKGQEIGRIGESGMTFEPVLYFSLKNTEGALDPLSYFDR